MKSKVFKLAHKIKANFSSWSEALRFAWNKIKLQFKMNNSICFFEFKKKSTGEQRTVLGTLNNDYIDYEYKGGSWSKWYILRFYDTVKQDWRSLDVRTLTKIYL